MPTPVTDPALLAQLEGPKPVTDPALLAQLEGKGGGYLDTLRQMAQESADQIKTGVNQATGADHFGAVDKGVTNAVFGGLGLIGSPVNAAIRQYVSQPLENKTGIPKEYTETAAGFLPLLRRAPPAGPAFEASAIKSAAKESYRAADKIGVGSPIPGKAVEALRADMQTTLHGENVRGARAEPILDVLKKELPEGETIDAGHLVNLHRELRGVGGAAETLLPKVESALKQYAPGALENITRANADYSSASNIERLDKNFQKAESPNTRLYVGDKIRTAAQQAATGPNARYMKPPDIADLQRVAEGTRMQNALRGFAQEGRGLPAQVGMGAYTHGVGNLLMTPATWAARGLYNNSVARSADLARQSIAMRSPFYASQAATLAAKQRALAAQQELAGAMRGAASIGLLAPAANRSLLGQ